MDSGWWLCFFSLSSSLHPLFVTPGTWSLKFHVLICPSVSNIMDSISRLNCNYSKWIQNHIGAGWSSPFFAESKIVWWTRAWLFVSFCQVSENSFFSESYRNHIFNAILKYLRFPPPSWLMLGSLPFLQVKSWIHSRCPKQSNMTKDSPSDPEVRHLPCGILICARSPKVTIKCENHPFKDFWFNRKKHLFKESTLFRRKLYILKWW